MAIQNLILGDSASTARSKINNNYSEMYSGYTTLSANSATWWSFDPYGIQFFDKQLIQTATRTTFGLSVGGYTGGVLSTDGLIYCVPDNSTDILIINPFNDTATKTTFGLTLSDVDKWEGAVLGKNGKIYGIPSLSNDILIIDPINKIANRTNVIIVSQLKVFRT